MHGVQPSAKTMPSKRRRSHPGRRHPVQPQLALTDREHPGEDQAEDDQTTPITRVMTVWYA